MLKSSHSEIDITIDCSILIQIFVVTGDGTINGLLSSIGGKMTKEAFELVLKKFNIQVIHYFFPLLKTVLQ